MDWSLFPARLGAHWWSRLYCEANSGENRPRRESGWFSISQSFSIATELNLPAVLDCTGVNEMSKKKTQSSSSAKKTARKPGGVAVSTLKSHKVTADGHKKRSKSMKMTKAAAQKKSVAKPLVMEREKGPREWLFPVLESAYSKLVPREANKAAGDGDLKPAKGVKKLGAFRSVLQPARGEEVLASPTRDMWLDRLREYKSRKATRAIAMAALRPGPAIPGAKNWAPLGPSAVLNGQAVGQPTVGGRVSGVAIAPGGNIVYAASANGGVFRSDDGGMSWRSLMDAFDVDPTNFASTSLACGAIAIDRNDPNRVYVGTGEGDTYAIFSQRITNALPAYRGIGPIRSDDGGDTWEVEATASGSPLLAGEAFFALAVDPADRENVIAATSKGLYQRTIGTGGSAEWVLRRAGLFSSVAVASAGTTLFVAAEWGKGVSFSPDGSQWTDIKTGFPTSKVGRIALAMQPNNPNLVYAFVANTKGALLGVYRLDGVNASWKAVASPPDVLPAADDGSSQGDYDLAIAVDPADVNLIFLGGSYFSDGQFWPASVWRCRVQTSGSGYRMTSESIGTRAHADVHLLVHSPGDPNALWVGCDGGLFLNRAPRTSANFASRNDGLACLCPNFFAQHPTDPNILFCGLQDNGTARTGGGPIWRHVNGGDGGYCLINWADPQQVIVFANGTVYRATDGGLDHGSWSEKEFPWAMMTEPIVGPPYNPSHPQDASVVALGTARQTSSGFKRVIYISNDFGATWPTNVTIPTQGGIFALVSASPSRFYVGTSTGEVFRVDRTASSWQVTRLDTAAAGPLELDGLVSDIAIDWTDSSLASIYLAYGGVGDYRHVWHFDGTRWEARSGQPAAGANNLLDVEHNAIVVDRESPNNVYVGADIGVWHSPDRGQNWDPLPNGLPDAPIFDLQIHPTRRLLRASAHGRGLYEYPLNPA
jgi:hypothetical protein